MNEKTYQDGRVEMAKEFMVVLQMAYDELDCHPDVLKTAEQLRDSAINAASNLELLTLRDIAKMEMPDPALSNMRTAVQIYENNIKETGRWDSVAWRLADALLIISKRCPKNTEGIDKFTGMGAKLCVKS